MSTSTTNPPLLVVGRVFTADPNAPWAEAVLTNGDRIAYVGSQEQARRLAPADVEVVIADGVVLPGFVDGHAHLQMSGAALLQAQLRSCASLAEIGDALAEWRTRHPDAKRVLGLGWWFSAVPDGTPTRQMLDAFVGDVPVYLTRRICIRCGPTRPACTNSASTTPHPTRSAGGSSRDDAGRATGLLLENAAIELAWPVTNRTSRARARPLRPNDRGRIPRRRDHHGRRHGTRR